MVMDKPKQRFSRASYIVKISIQQAVEHLASMQTDQNRVHRRQTGALFANAIRPLFGIASPAVPGS